MCTGNQSHCKVNTDGQRTTSVLEMPRVQPNDRVLFVVLTEIPEWLRPAGHCNTSREYFCIFSQMAPWFISFLFSSFSSCGMLHTIIARQGIIYDIKVPSFKTLKVQAVICYEL